MLERARKFRTAPFPSEFNLLKLFVRNPVLFKLFLAMILLHVNRLFAPVRNLNDGLCEHLMSSGHLCYWKLPHVAFTIMESSDVFLSLMRASPAPCSTWKACRFFFAKLGGSTKSRIFRNFYNVLRNSEISKKARVF